MQRAWRLIPSLKSPFSCEAAARQDWARALAIANKFPQLGVHKVAIRRAYNAIHFPHFYRVVGQDTKALVQAGIEALRVRYQLQ